MAYTFAYCHKNTILCQLIEDLLTIDIAAVSYANHQDQQPVILGKTKHRGKFRHKHRPSAVNAWCWAICRASRSSCRNKGHLSGNHLKNFILPLSWTIATIGNVFIIHNALLGYSTFWIESIIVAPKVDDSGPEHL